MLIVALDGPAASGKGTVGKMVAKQCKLNYFDTGILYRILAYYMLKNNIEYTDVPKISYVAKHLIQELYNNLSHLTILHTEEISDLASKIAPLQEIRTLLNKMQRDYVALLHNQKGCIFDGRDIGSVVFPNANIKVFLTASIQERAKRRYLDYKKGYLDISYDSVLQALKKRDNRDYDTLQRPKHLWHETHTIDTSSLQLKEVVNLVALLINKSQ